MPEEHEQVEQACERFNDRLREKLSKHYQEYRFLPNGAAEEVFRNHKQDLKRLLQNVDEALAADRAVLSSAATKIQEKLSNVLAIVLMTRKRDDTAFLDQFLRLFLRDSQVLETLALSDSDLPIPRALAKSLFPDRGRGEDFFETQFRCCAIVLQQGKELSCTTVEQIRRPMPYLNQKSIGSGGFGNVFRVEIAKHHMISANGDDENRKPVLLARKDFQIQNAFLRELTVLKEITKRPQKHDHLVPLLAILHRESTYSLFFPLASCDLGAYFEDTRTPVPRHLDAKEALYHRGADLAGALSFLHSMSCFHLDLKPANILVFHRGTPDEVWKISDFGLSSVRIKATSQSEGDSTMATGAPGTCLAPECAVTGGRVSALSDVWSFGCIFSLVLTFIMEGPSGVLEFGRRRNDEPSGDTFYDRHTLSVSRAVPTWFKHLKDLPSPDPWPNVISAALDFLLGKVLLPERNERMRSSEIEAELKKIWATNTGSRPDSSSITNDGQPVDGSTPKKGIFPWTRSTPKPALSPLGVRGSRFSPKGDILVAYTSNENWIYELKPSHTQSLQATVQISGDINSVSVSNKYICNGLEGDCFKCCIYALQGESTNKRPALITLPGLGSIKMATQSTDGTLVAFIIVQEPGRNDMECVRYLCRTEDLTRANYGVHPTPISSRSNSEVSVPSLVSTRTRSTATQLGPAVGSDAEIRFFGFASDGQFLVMVTQIKTTGFRVMAWKTQGDALYQDSPYSEKTISYNGSSTTTAAHFTACTTFVQEGNLRLFILSQEQFLISVDMSSRRTRSWQVRHLSHKVIHIRHSIDNRTLIFLKSNRQQIYTLSLSTFDENLEDVTLLPSGKVKGKPKQGQVNMVMRKKDTGKVEALLAASDEVVCYFEVT